MLSLCLCNKVPYIYGVVFLSALYLFWISGCLHMLCRKLYRKTSVGETHHDNKTRSDRENHEIRKVISEGPCPTKRASSSPWSKPLGLLFGLASPSLCHLTSCFVYDQVCGPYTLFSHVMLSVLNRIENSLIKQL